jgi:hypothetical protein
MHPADWIWQKYGLCLGWRCASCKEKVMARSLPFKGLRKRTLDPDEIAAAAETKAEEADPEKKPASSVRPVRGRDASRSVAPRTPRPDPGRRPRGTE